MGILARGREDGRRFRVLLPLLVGLSSAVLLPAVAANGAAPAGRAAAATLEASSIDETDPGADASEPGHAAVEPGSIPEGSFIRVTVDGGVSPFTSVSWDVTVRGATAMVSLVKETLCQTGQRERVRLLEGANAKALLATLRTAGAWTCTVPPVAVSGRAADRSAPKDQPRYEVWSAWGRRMIRYSLTQADLVGAPCALGVITAVTSEVRARVEPLPMRDLYYPAEKLGFVSITVSESATATIDGWDTVHLPTDALEVVEGEHVLVVTGVSGRTRQFKLKVAPGLSQRIHVLLEDGEGGRESTSPLPR